MSDAYAPWIGRSEEVEEVLDRGPALSAAALLDAETTLVEAGSPLPPLWHWFYFLPRVPQSQLGVDGHPQRGGFMPPITLPRRMFAGARLRFVRPLRMGEPARRRAEIRSVVEKDGRSGKLAFVTVAYRITQDGQLCLEEEQTIVYREPGPPGPPPRMAALPDPPAGASSRLITPDPTLLFRFSALTFNAHRIHYDRDYAVREEGYPGLVVHGPLAAVLLMELLRSVDPRRAATFVFRSLGPLFDLAPFRLLALPGPTGACLEAQGPDGQTALAATVEFA